MRVQSEVHLHTPLRGPQPTHPRDGVAPGALPLPQRRGRVIGEGTDDIAQRGRGRKPGRLHSGESVQYVPPRVRCLRRRTKIGEQELLSDQLGQHPVDRARRGRGKALVQPPLQLRIAHWPVAHHLQCGLHRGGMTDVDFTHAVLRGSGLAALILQGQVRQRETVAAHPAQIVGRDPKFVQHIRSGGPRSRERRDPTPLKPNRLTVCPSHTHLSGLRGGRESRHRDPGHQPERRAPRRHPQPVRGQRPHNPPHVGNAVLLTPQNLIPTARQRRTGDTHRLPQQLVAGQRTQILHALRHLVRVALHDVGVSDRGVTHGLSRSPEQDNTGT